jgi:putative AbiEi antitoxin of type IV toxin-antitoxin system
VPGPSSVHRELAPLARLQAGVVTREQVLAHGVSDRTVARLLTNEHWRRVRSGVYLTSGGEPSFESLAWAGVLAAGSAARVGGAAAAHLDGLLADPPAPVLVLVPHGQILRSCDRWHFVRERPGAREARSVGAPPRTTVEDTVLDLCATAPAADVVGWATVAVQRRKTTPARLLRALERRRRHPRRVLLQALLADVAVGAESPLEIVYLRDVERAHGLPPAVRQRPSRDRRALRDVRYPAYRVVVELDGRLGHGELGRFRDMDRDNVAGLDGLFTMRYGAGDLYGRPCAIAHQVGVALQQRGWSGLISGCPRCRAVPDSDWV